MLLQGCGVAALSRHGPAAAASAAGGLILCACCAAAAMAEAWGPGGPKALSPAEHAEAALALDLLVTASMQVAPPDLPALAYVARTAALLEVQHTRTC